MTIVSPIFGNLELPLDDSILNQVSSIQGWVFSENTNKVITKIYVDEKLIYETPNGMPRFDIFKKYDDSERAYRSGFLANLLLFGYPDGEHTIKAISSFEKFEKIIGTKTFTLKKLPHIDRSTSTWFDNLTHQRFNEEFPVPIQMNRDFCNIQPDSNILEIGCAYGRNVRAFTKILSKNGSFNGIDIIPSAIEYCKKNISQRYPNFIFNLAPVYNSHYNPSGTIKSEEYTLPYEDESFDLVFLISVFTHMVPIRVENYLKEISRVLKKGGRCVITYNLLNEKSIKIMNSDKPGQTKFPFEFEGCRTVLLKNPDGLTAHYESTIRKFYENSKLTINEPIQYGWWAWDTNKTKPLNNQDTIIATK